MKRNAFAKKERLKKYDQIKEIFRRGIPFKGKFLKAYFLEREKEFSGNRVAFLVGKHLYNKKAVLRNQYRRILREAYRNTKHSLDGSFDIVLTAGSISKNTTLEAIKGDLENVFKRCNKKYNKILS
ncbi:MAG: ribonuclease P protein component [Candidatus Omnitrophota bacterium]